MPGGDNLMADLLEFLDPDCRPVLARLAAGRERRRGGADAPAQMRERAAEIFRSWNAGGPKLASVEDIVLPGAAGSGRVRRYVPTAAARPRPTLFYMHGGGWIIGDLDAEDRYLRELALSADVQVLSLDYALAPEHRFPRPLTDCRYLIQAALERASALQIDTAHIALGGSSAGANLAVATALELRDLRIAGQALLLNCGVFVTVPRLQTPAGAEESGVGPADMEYFLSQYLPDPARRVDPRVNVAAADLRGLPPAKLIVGGIDPLRDDSIALARRLCDCGVACELSLYPGLIHGFMTMVSEVRAARRAILEGAAFLRRALAADPAGGPVP
jgi:acetyl esterase